MMRNVRTVVWSLAVGLMLTATPNASVRASPVRSSERSSASETVETQIPEMDWGWAIRTGRWPMGVLAGMSVLTLALALYFFASLRLTSVAPPALHRELMEKIRAEELDDARRACEYRSSPLSAVVLAALDYLRQNSRSDALLLKDATQGEGERQAGAIEGQIHYLQDVAIIAPMVGLLGTVLGMLRAFSSVSRDIAQAQPIALAEGVSQALVTTAFGLIVGIVAMMFHAFFKRRAASLIGHLESAATETLAALAGLCRTASREGAP